MPLVTTARGNIWAAIHRRNHAAPCAIFIHGAGGSRLSWPKPLRQLAAFRPILIDLPGHGASASVGRQTIGDYALDIVALMDALAIEVAIVVGHSMGGAIAQQLALEHGQRVRALVLAGAGPHLPVNPALLSGIITDTKSTIDRMSRWMWSHNAPSDLIAQTAEIMRATPPAVFQGDLFACHSFDIRDRLGEIAIPTLILAGEHDKMTPVSLSQALAAGMPNAQLNIVPDAGHMLQLEQPDHTANLIDQWLTGLP